MRTPPIHRGIFMTWEDMVAYRKRHDKVVFTLAKELNATIFSTAPFDLLTEDRKFIEVKVCNGKRPKFKISEDELKVAGILGNKYLIYFYYHGKRTEIKGSRVVKWASSLSWEKQYGHKRLRQKNIELMNKYPF